MIVYVGEFTEEDLKNGSDKKAILEAQESPENKRNGIRFIEAKEVFKKKKFHSMKIWLTDRF
jgi:hypothetical protein